MSDEFRRALAEVRVGKARRDALRDMVPRTNVAPLSAFIGAIVQAEQLGVSISKVLQIQSEQLRIERRQRAEEMAAKAPIKMLFPLVGCIFPSLFIVILGPAIISIVKTFSSGALQVSRRRLVARNVSRGTQLAERLENGSSFWAKFMGLMGRAALPDGDGLWLPGENGIHMLFMRFPIDVVFVAPTFGRRTRHPASRCRCAVPCHRGGASSGGSAAPKVFWSCRSARSTKSGTQRRRRESIVGRALSAAGPAEPAQEYPSVEARYAG